MLQSPPGKNGALPSEDLRDQLKTLVDDKKEQLALVGALGHRFLSQQVELEERIQQLDNVSLNDVDDELVRVKLADLAHTIKSWESEDQQTWATALSLSNRMTGVEQHAYPLETSIVNVSNSLNSSYDEDFGSSALSGPSAAQSSRRAKNAGITRPHTVEFATEIGNQLTREIRRVQALLSERDKTLQDLKEERDDLERNVESLKMALRERETAAEKFKDENWNLEYQVQELQNKLSEALSDQQRLETEQKRTFKQFATVREVADSHKNEAERLQTALNDLKVKHETDIAQMRKATVSLQREKSDTQASLDALKIELSQRARAIPQFTSPNVSPEPYNDLSAEEDVFNGGSSRRKLDSSFAAGLNEADTSEDSPNPSTASPSLVPSPVADVDSLKQSLAHAHRQMSSLRNSVQREKEAKLELRRRLAQELGSPIDWEDDEVAENSPVPSRSRRADLHPHRAQPSKRKPATLAQKLGIATVEPAVEGAFIGSGYPDGYTGLQALPLMELVAGSRRPISIQGLDPVYANVLRISPSVDAGEGSGDLPLEAKSSRRRGGAAFGAEVRPNSLVDAAPSAALSTELGDGEFESDDTSEESGMANAGNVISTPSHDVTSKRGTHTGVPYLIKSGTVLHEVSEDIYPVSSPGSTSISRGTYADAATQCDPDSPEVALNVPPSTRDASIQASVEFKISHASTQTNAVQIRLLASVSVSTDHEASPLRADASTLTLLTSMAEVGIQATNESYTLNTLPPSAETETVSPSLALLQSQSHLLTSTSTIAVPRLSSAGRPTSMRPVAMIFDDESETETESEYVDARETEPTPSSSVQEFQSFHSTDESDAESIRTSVATPSYVKGSVGTVDRRSRYDSVATTRAVQLSKPDTRECGIQTEDWVTPLSPPPLETINFLRSGSSQPFQFIAPQEGRPSEPMSSLVLAASVVKSPIRESTNLSATRARTSSVVSADDTTRLELPRDTDDITSSSIMSMVDRSRPPKISLPPPPSMPPPSLVPAKKSSIPPPRPTSPIPPDLLQRATTPTFGRQNALNVPANRAPRASMTSQTVSNSLQTSLRQPISTTSFKSANGGARGPLRSGPPPPTFIDPAEDKRFMSQTSLLSASSAPRSRRASVASSRSSEKGLPSSIHTGGPHTPGSVHISSTTDPAVIHAITQTMIGEFLFKYTRRVVGKGHGEKRHKRFFWVHPYTKTLYWSSADPGASNAGESNAKSAYIDAVKQVIDPNPMPPGLHQYSIVVYTPQREMKFTAPTKERHDIWFKALSYLLDRPPAPSTSSPGVESMPPSPLPPKMRPAMSVGEDGIIRGQTRLLSSPASVRSATSNDSMDSWNLTPRARAVTHLSPSSAGRRQGTPAAEYLRTRPNNEPASRPIMDPQSPTRAVRTLQQRFEDALARNDDEDYENVDSQSMTNGDIEIHPDDGFEGIENVRACCDGEHDLNHLSSKTHHHPNQHHQFYPAQATFRPSSRLSNHSNRLEPISPRSRPASPSAFSGRSRSGSQRSEGGSIFTWVGGDGSGKRSLRFNSRRSTKYSTAPIT